MTGGRLHRTAVTSDRKVPTSDSKSRAVTRLLRDRPARLGGQLAGTDGGAGEAPRLGLARDGDPGLGPEARVWPVLGASTCSDCTPQPLRP
jgi:hypothetical protein